MTRDDAAQLLGLSLSARADEVRQRFQELYSDYQIRLTNAPTPSLKRTYQQNLRELEEASRLLLGGGADAQADLPAAEPSYGAVVPESPTGRAAPTTRHCPFCDEEIRAAAKVCKHCGRDVPADAVSPKVPVAATVPAAAAEVPVGIVPTRREGAPLRVRRIAGVAALSIVLLLGAAFAGKMLFSRREFLPSTGSSATPAANAAVAPRGDSGSPPSRPKADSTISGSVTVGPGGGLEPSAADARWTDTVLTSAGLAGDQWRWIPPGTFAMGSGDRDANDDEAPAHAVKLTQGFWLMRSEVTQAQWQSVMHHNPSEFKNCGPSCPVENVSWEDVQQFITALNQKVAGAGFRLPTEAEWEYAARGGRATPGLETVRTTRAWYEDNSGPSTHPICGKPENAWGLCDMLGNVWEWVSDHCGSYPSSQVTDPKGSDRGDCRMTRGASWASQAEFLYIARRGGRAPNDRTNYIGFRLARSFQ